MRAVTTGIIAGLIIATANMAPASPAPDRKHQAWPSNPTWREIANRARPGELATLRSIAECEQPGSGTSPASSKYEPPVRWHTAWGINAGATYIGAYGMYRGTYGIGQGPTNAPAPPSATPAQETAVALVVLRRFGPKAWGCG
jgi:hypothetical protein